MSTSSVSSSSSSTTYSSSSGRITGMVSGLDTDSIVKQLMEAEKVPLNKLKQKEQLAEWKQDEYREVTSELTTFMNTYFNYSNSSTNMLSQSVYQQFAASTTDDSVVTVSAGSSAEAGSHTITVSQLATAATYKSTQGITGGITASSAADYSDLSGSSFVINIDGTKTTVTLDSSVTSKDTLQTAIDNAVGSGKIEVTEDSSGVLTITKGDGSGIGTITLSSGDDDNALSKLGFSSDGNLSNYLDTTDTLSTISSELGVSSTMFNSDGNISFTINGESFTFSKNTTLKAMMKEVNASDAGVTMKYDTATDSFTITANSTGAGQKISLSDTKGSFLDTMGFLDTVTDSDGNVVSGYTAGTDAVATIDGNKVTRSNNSFTLDGVTYTLKSTSSDEQTVSVTQDTDGIYDSIKTFVDAYNTLIDDINEKISEEYDRDYPPLTDDQKDEMSDDEITAWEKKAKTGLLENDSTLTTLLSNMRSAMYNSVSGVSVQLTEIGITTSSDYEDKGKLEIDEDTLKEALENDPDGVMNLFSQESESYPGTTTVRSLTSSERKTRTSEEGLAYRLYDLLQDNVSTYTDSSGNKGILIEKAGLEGDGSEYDNTLTSQINKYADEISDLEDKLSDKEDYYYEKFSTMETYINSMNSQLTALQSYLS